MHNWEKCFNLGSEITSLSTHGGKYAAITTGFGTALINSLEDYNVRLIFDSDLLSPQATVMSFSPDARLLAIALESKVYVKDVMLSEVVNEIDIEAKDVEMMTFDDTSEYLIVGTKHGRVFQYKYDNSSVLARLCSFPYDRSNIPKDFENYVSAIDFCNTKIACSGYGGAIFIMDFHINTYREVLSHSSTRKDALCFIDHDTLISGDEDGNIDVIKLSSSNITYETIKTKFKNIKKIVAIPNTTFIFVTFSDECLAIVDYEDLRVENSCYLEFFNEITNISLLDEKTFVLSLENSDIIKLNLPTTQQVDEFIANNSIEKTLKLAANESVIKKYKSYLKVEKEYEKIYAQSTKALMEGDRIGAIKLIKDFKDIKTKQQDIKELFDSFSHYKKLKLFLQQKNFEEAYRLCKKFPLLEETAEYKFMESKWQQSFLRAQNEILSGNIIEAKKALLFFKDVTSKKQFCSFVFKHSKEFSSFLKAFKTKDFNTIHEISQRYTSFKKIPGYINLEKKLEGSLRLVENCILKANIKLAKTHIAKIENIPIIAQEVKKLKEKCNYVLQLKEAYEKKDLLQCYKILDSKKFLINIALGNALEKHWAKTIAQCEKHALDGDVKGIKQTLKGLIHIESRKSKLGDLLRVGYHTVIKKLIKQGSMDDAKKTLEKYLTIFGIDHEIEDIIKTYEEKSSQTFPYKDKGYKRGDRDNWRAFIDEI